MPRVAQIGVGRFGQNHKRILQEIGVLEATCDINGKEDYDNISDLFEYERFDHAVVCTPPHTHSDIINHLQSHQIHTFVEKPMCMTARETAHALLRNGGKLQVGMIEQYNPIVNEIKAQQPKYLNLVREGPRNEYFDNILLDTTIHDIDLAMYIFEDMPIKITGSHTEDYAEIILDFDYNRIAHIITGWDRPKNRRINGISIETRENILRYELEDFIDNYNVSWEAHEVAKVIDKIK